MCESGFKEYRITLLFFTKKVKMNEAFMNEEMARRILQNQRAILEQNRKTLTNQEANKAAQENLPKKQRDVVPAIVKVSLKE